MQEPDLPAQRLRQAKPKGRGLHSGRQKDLSGLTRSLVLAFTCFSRHLTQAETSAKGTYVCLEFFELAFTFGTLFGAGAGVHVPGGESHLQITLLSPGLLGECHRKSSILQYVLSSVTRASGRALARPRACSARSLQQAHRGRGRGRRRGLHGLLARLTSEQQEDSYAF